MSLVISNVAINFISKKEESGETVLHRGPETVAITPKIEGFINSLHSIYDNKGNKAFGSFSDDLPSSESTSFQSSLKQYLSNEDKFNAFSSLAAKLLTDEITKYDIIESGYLVLSHYDYMGGQYLLVAVVPVSDHYSVDGQLNISADKHLDTSKLQLAARIDLFDLIQNTESHRYISFIKGRAGRKVSDFFLDFLGCIEGVNPKQQTQILVNAVEDYVSANQLDSDEKQSTRRDLVSFCKEQDSTSQTLSLQELSNSISPDGTDKSFYEFCQEQEFQIDDNFPHEQSIVNKITKYSGFGNGISISFERSHFGTDVVYNNANDSLTIYKVPPNLKDQLLQLLSNG